MCHVQGRPPPPTERGEAFRTTGPRGWRGPPPAPCAEGGGGGAWLGPGTPPHLVPPPPSHPAVSPALRRLPAPPVPSRQQSPHVSPAAGEAFRPAGARGGRPVLSQGDRPPRINHGSGRPATSVRLHRAGPGRRVGRAQTPLGAALGRGPWGERGMGALRVGGALLGEPRFTGCENSLGTPRPLTCSTQGQRQGAPRSAWLSDRHRVRGSQTRQGRAWGGGTRRMVTTETCDAVTSSRAGKPSWARE